MLNIKIIFKGEIMEIKVTNLNFEEEVIKSDIPVVVDFWASWCAPCRMLAPILEEVASENEGRFKVGKINIDEEMELATKFKVYSIPTIMVFKGGERVGATLGYMSKEELEEFINSNI